MAFSLTEFLDNLYTTTWQNMKDDVADQIFDSTPFWFWMRDKGKLKTIQGGRWISEPLQYAKNDNVSWIGKGGTVPLNDFEHLTIAKYDWKYLVGSIVRFGVDDQQNRGKNQIINLMNSKMENTQNALVDTLETTLAAGTASGNEFDGLELLVSDDGTGTIGGINAGTNTWWKNKFKDMTGLSFASNGEAEMRTMLNNTSNNLSSDRPDIILSGQEAYEYFDESQMQYVQLVNNKLGDAGFTNIMFKGLPMIWSPAVTEAASDKMYFLNTRYLTFVYDPVMFFDMTDWKPIPDQVNDRAAQIITACSFVTSRRRCQGVLHNIDTA
jgi:hypothetical protein